MGTIDDGERKNGWRTDKVQEYAIDPRFNPRRTRARAILNCLDVAAQATRRFGNLIEHHEKIYPTIANREKRLEVTCKTAALIASDRFVLKRAAIRPRKAQG